MLYQNIHFLKIHARQPKYIGHATFKGKWYARLLLSSLLHIHDSRDIMRCMNSVMCSRNSLKMRCQKVYMNDVKYFFVQKGKRFSRYHRPFNNITMVIKSETMIASGTWVKHIEFYSLHFFRRGPFAVRSPDIFRHTRDETRTTF